MDQTTDTQGPRALPKIIYVLHVLKVEECELTPLLRCSSLRCSAEATPLSNASLQHEKALLRLTSSTTLRTPCRRRRMEMNGGSMGR